MKPPSKFEIMRINRGFTQFVNDKAQLLAEIDCTELHVLRTLRAGDKEEAYPAAERVAREGKRQAEPDTFFPHQVADSDQPVAAAPAPERVVRFDGKFKDDKEKRDFVAAARQGSDGARHRKPNWLSRLFAWNLDGESV